jgi:ectoine hydroxylase-related dioxygenase (phytanoyl-CoA dioxygenase family)
MNDNKKFKHYGYLQKKLFTEKQILNFNKNLYFNAIQFLAKKDFVKKPKYSFESLQKILKYLYANEIDNFKKLYAFCQNSLFSIELVRSPNFLNFVSKILNVKKSSLMVGDLTVRLDNLGKSSAHIDYHQESSYYPNIGNYEKSLLVWFPLHDIEENDGGLSFISQSHLLGKQNHKFFKQKKNCNRKPYYSSKFLQKNNQRVFIGSAGEVLACDFNLFHSSSVNNGNTFRISAAFRLFSSDARNFQPFQRRVVDN